MVMAYFTKGYMFMVMVYFTKGYIIMVMAYFTTGYIIMVKENVKIIPFSPSIYIISFIVVPLIIHVRHLLINF